MRTAAGRARRSASTTASSAPSPSVATRTALHRDRLDLGAWHGFHELLLREPVTPERLALRFRLRRTGLARARSPPHDGARFEAVRALARPRVPFGVPRRQRRREVRRAQGPSRMPRSRDAAGMRSRSSARRGALPRHARRRRRRALRPRRSRCRRASGCAARRRTTSRSTTSASTRHAPPLRVDEDFANHRRAPLVFGSALALLLAARRGSSPGRARRAWRRAAPAVALANGVVLACAGGSRSSPTPSTSAASTRRTSTSPATRTRSSTRARSHRASRSATRSAPPPPGVRRIVVLGTSQTWGSGAARPEDVWVPRLEALLNAAARPRRALRAHRRRPPRRDLARARRTLVRGAGSRGSRSSCS